MGGLRNKRTRITEGHDKQKNWARGFTIVELLIVIVVLGILAGIVTTGFTTAQAKARTSKVNADIRQIEKAVLAGRERTGRTFKDITNNGCTRCACPYLSGDMTVYSTLPKTHSCWTSYYNSLTALGAAADTSLSDLRAGDPWGSPYMIDENEGENVATPCNRDTVLSAGSSGNTNGGTSLGNISIRNFLSGCT